ncbi:hypothetical protein AB0H37_00030 [Actinomadura sp. NPDC023710]|uniref:hypothetical protein n=1 Tax=Actinomadura sp. NPDC023710 TaxID=3158219 RepID=UPI0033F6F315
MPGEHRELRVQLQAQQSHDLHDDLVDAVDRAEVQAGAPVETPPVGADGPGDPGAGAHDEADAVLDDLHAALLQRRLQGEHGAVAVGVVLVVQQTAQPGVGSGAEALALTAVADSAVEGRRVGGCDRPAGEFGAERGEAPLDVFRWCGCWVGYRAHQPGLCSGQAPEHPAFARRPGPFFVSWDTLGPPHNRARH